MSLFKPTVDVREKKRRADRSRFWRVDRANGEPDFASAPERAKRQAAKRRREAEAWIAEVKARKKP